MKHCLAIAAAFGLSGCMGTVQSTRLDHRYAEDTAVEGVSYALPMLQYDISITHTLTGCTTLGDASGPSPKDATSLTFDTQVDRTARYVPGERFNVDYRKLSGLFRTSSFSIEYYPNGTIKSIGAAADDRTGDAIKSAAKLASGIIALTTGTPAPVARLNDESTKEFAESLILKSPRIYDCSDSAKKLVTALDTAKGELKDAKDSLAAINSTVEGLARRFALKISKDGDAAIWDKAISDQLAAQRVLAAKQKALETAKEPLSASYKLTWPMERIPASGELKFADRFAPGGVLIERWSKLIVATPLVQPNRGEIEVANGCTVVDGGTPLPCLAEHMDLFLHFDSDWPQPERWTQQQAQQAFSRHLQQQAMGRDDGYVKVVDTRNKTLDGLLYREPAHGGVVICLKKYVSEGKCSDDRLVEPEMVNFPQAGQLRFIPFSVLPFQGKDQAIEFTADGYPSKIALKSTKAAGAEALAAAADATSSIVDALEKREDEERSDAKAARDQQIAELSAEIDLLEKQAKIADLRAPASQPSAASLQLAEINADIEQKRATLLQLMLSNGIATGSIDPAILFGS